MDIERLGIRATTGDTARGDHPELPARLGLRSTPGCRFPVGSRLALVVAGLVLFAAGAAQAFPAEIGLTVSVQDPRVITGGSTKLFANVSNTALGSDDPRYHVDFSHIVPEEDPDGVLAAAASKTWEADWSTSSPGPNPPSVTVSDPNAGNNPQTRVFDVEVLAHSHPFLEFAGIIWDLLTPPVEPTITPEQFAATGGGEDFAALAPNVFGDPPIPTADLDLDRVSWTGDPEITTDLEPFFNLPHNDDPNFGHPFNIFISLTNPGTFTKQFFLFFSDEDLPGASSPESVATSFTVVATVVPEPSTGLLLVFALAGLAAMRRRSVN